MLKNLKALRTRAGISQQQLADLVIVSQQSINKYENHEVEPNLATLCAIADYFDVSVDYLVGRTDVEKRSEPTVFCELNAEEQALIQNFRHNTKKDRERLLDLSARLLESL